MSVKESVSQGYVQRQLDEHQHKPYPLPDHRAILLTGAEKPHSIGEEVKRRLTTRNIFTVAPTRNDMDVQSDMDLDELFRSWNEVNFTSLVCCHGYTWLDWIENQPDWEIRDVIEINLTGTLKLVNRFVRATINNPFHKTIVLTGSMAYNHVLNGSAPYCASKAGLAMAVRCLASELAPKGYSVFGVHPSNVAGAPMTEDTITGLMRYRGLTRDEAESYWGAYCPKGRFLGTTEVATTILSLLEPDAEYLSGANLELAGGQR